MTIHMMVNRVVKRVPLTFDHPIGMVWPGYLPPEGLSDNELDEWAEHGQQTEPPTGEGYQLWETTTEGSPNSPVFPTAEQLAVWMSTNPCWHAGDRISYGHALEFVLDQTGGHQ